MELRSAMAIPEDFKFLFFKKGQKGFVKLQSTDVSAIAQKMTVFAGLDTHTTSHSLRKGGATAAMKSGYTIEQICVIGRWKNPSTAFINYLKASITTDMGFSNILSKKEIMFFSFMFLVIFLVL